MRIWLTILFMPNEADLTRPCDACGKPIGGGFKHCPKCNIWFCFFCGADLMLKQKALPPNCPMCGEKLK